MATIAVGPGHVCGSSPDGAVRCWGSNGRGELGDGTKTNSLVPVQVSGITDAQAVGVGYEHSCAIRGASVSCWGANDHGQLGDGTRADSVGQ